MTPERISHGGRPIVGFGEALHAPTAPPGSPWPMLLASSVVSAAAGWAIEEVVLAVKKKRKRR